MSKCQAKGCANEASWTVRIGGKTYNACGVCRWATAIPYMQTPKFIDDAAKVQQREKTDDIDALADSDERTGDSDAAGDIEPVQ
jgi:hypothetical protein